MDKSKTIIREGYVVCREEKLNGKHESSLYCVLKPNTLCFHQRKVHKKHTPLGLLKLGELTVDIEEDTGDNCNGDDVVDCNNNRARFPWTVESAEHKLFLYCASFADRTAWVDAIEAAKTSSCCVTTNSDGNGTNETNLRNCTIERASERSKLTSEVNESVENHQLFDPKSVDNYSSHTPCEQTANTSGTMGRNEDNCVHEEPKTLTRVRSHSLSEVEKPSDVVKDSAQYTRYIKSKSAPPDNGKRGCKTVDKLIHTGLCRQLVKWI